MTKSGVEVGPGCFCGVGSSSRTRTVGIGFGSSWVRRFLQWNGWNGVERPFWSSSSERMIGSDIWEMGGTGNEQSMGTHPLHSDSEVRLVMSLPL